MSVLEVELTRVTDESVGLELEKNYGLCFLEIPDGFDGLVRDKVEVEKNEVCEIVFLKKGVNELRANLENERSSLRRPVCLVRDLLKTEIDDLVEETKGLRDRLRN
ncbi:major antigen-like [Fagus crenata]